MSAITIRIPSELRKELEKISRRQHRTVSDLAREALRERVVKDRFEEASGRIRAHAEAQGFLTDEDVFKAIS